MRTRYEVFVKEADEDAWSSVGVRDGYNATAAIRVVIDERGRGDDETASFAATPSRYWTVLAMQEVSVKRLLPAR